MRLIDDGIIMVQPRKKRKHVFLIFVSWQKKNPFTGVYTQEYLSKVKVGISLIVNSNQDLFYGFDHIFHKILVWST